MIRFRATIKAWLPSSLLNVLRVYQARTRYLLTLRQFGDNSLWVDVVASLRSFFWPRKTILFFPELPPKESVEYKLLLLLGFAITANPNRRFDVAFKRKDATFFDQSALEIIPTSRNKIINATSVDISKQAVGEAFANVFGYALEVDPTQYHGQIVEKSNKNATHDGRVIEGPIPQEDVRAGCVYQNAIDNTSDKDGLVIDYRVPIHGDQIPLVYLKYRPTETRFSNKNIFVILEEPSAMFSTAESDKLLCMARKMGIDYGEFDVLRDKDGRIYVVDVNNTPWGPPNGLPEFETKIALKRLVKSFDRLLEKRIS